MSLKSRGKPVHKDHNGSFKCNKTSFSLWWHPHATTVWETKTTENITARLSSIRTVDQCRCDLGRPLNNNLPLNSISRWTVDLLVPQPTNWCIKATLQEEVPVSRTVQRKWQVVEESWVDRHQEREISRQATIQLTWPIISWEAEATHIMHLTSWDSKLQTTTH